MLFPLRAEIHFPDFPYGFFFQFNPFLLQSLQKSRSKFPLKILFVTFLPPQHSNDLSQNGYMSMLWFNFTFGTILLFPLFFIHLLYITMHQNKGKCQITSAKVKINHSIFFLELQIVFAVWTAPAYFKT